MAPLFAISLYFTFLDNTIIFGINSLLSKIGLVFVFVLGLGNLKFKNFTTALIVGKSYFFVILTTILSIRYATYAPSYAAMIVIGSTLFLIFCGLELSFHRSIINYLSLFYPAFVLSGILFEFQLIDDFSLELELNNRFTVFGINQNFLAIFSAFIFYNLINSTKKNFFDVLTIICAVTVIFLSASRSGIFVLLFPLIIKVINGGSLMATVSLFVVGIIAFILFEFSPDVNLVSRLFDTLYNNNLSGRDSLWEPVLKYFDFSIFGFNPDDISFYLFLYGFGSFTSLHNVLLESIVYAGLVGFFSLFLFGINLIVRSFRTNDFFIYSICGGFVIVVLFNQLFDKILILYFLSYSISFFVMSLNSKFLKHLKPNSL